MISAVDDLDSVVRCIEMGAEDYLFKPFNPVLLKARVGASLDKHRQRNHNVELSRSVRDAITTILDDVHTLQAEAMSPEIAAVLQRIQTNVEQLSSVMNGDNTYDSQRIG
jgi:DNA-binding response OmpR family regulator